MTPLSKAQELPIVLQPVLNQSIADEEGILNPKLSDNPLQTEEDFSVGSLTNNIPTAGAVVGTISAMDGTMSGNLSQDDGDNPTRNGSLSDDYQLVDLAVGQWLTLWLNSSDFDPYLQLINSETGEVITDDDDSGEGTNSRLRFLPLEGINYLVRVTSYDEQETGSYTLATNTDPPVVGTLSAFQGTIAENLSDQDALNPVRLGTFSDDYQLVDLTVGEPVILDLSSEFFDPYLQLINAHTQQVMTFDDDSGEGVNSQLSFTPLQGINYLVRVTSYANQATGNYTLTAAPAPDLVVSGSISPTVAGLGETIEVSWSVTNQGRGTTSADWYDSIYLSSDAHLDSSDTWLANTWATERLPLLSGTSYSLNTYRCP